MAGGLLLDFDGSVAPWPGLIRVPLADWQERIRFGCTLESLQALETRLDEVLRREPSLVFTGSGDFHHVSHLLIRRLGARGARFRVVVLDNHPDNMRYPFGIHCGSWVRHASALPFVTRIDVLGITSSDIDLVHAWANYLGPLRSGKLSYWSIGRNPRWPRWLGAFGAARGRSFATAADLLVAFGAAVAEGDEPVYLSIDKDVLAADVAGTNWDQGVMRREELLGAVGLLKARVVAADVTGDVSWYRYKSAFKRLLSGLDGQTVIPAADIASWQAAHHALNRELAGLLLPG